MPCRFGKVIAVEIDDEWNAIDSAEQSLRLLETNWPDVSGPSCRRAVQSCRAYIDGRGTTLAARTTFAVAIMEVRLTSRFHDDYMAFGEAQIASVAESEVKRDQADILEQRHQESAAMA